MDREHQPGHDEFRQDAAIPFSIFPSAAKKINFLFDNFIGLAKMRDEFEKNSFLFPNNRDRIFSGEGNSCRQNNRRGPRGSSIGRCRLSICLGPIDFPRTNSCGPFFCPLRPRGNITVEAIYRETLLESR